MTSAQTPSIPARIGQAVLAIAVDLGAMTLLFARIMTNIFRLRLDRRELFRNFYRMGVQSLPVICATSVFVGAIMVLQAAPLVQRFNAKDLIGWGAGFATLREVGPLLIALVFNGRVGANNTAELASMTVTDQVDALRALAIDPIAFLVAPRFVAMIVTIFLLTVFGDAVAMIGAIGAAKALLDVDPRSFLNSLLVLLDERDFLVGLAKSVLFGFVVALASCHYGLSVKGGAPGVGRAVTGAVVAAASGVFVLDYLSTFVFG